MEYTETAVADAQRIAAEADRIIRERYDSVFEILVDEGSWDYVLAAPRDDEEGGDPNQPTAVTICDISEVENAETLYRRALKHAGECYDLAASMEER